MASSPAVIVLGLGAVAATVAGIFMASLKPKNISYPTVYKSPVNWASLPPSLPAPITDALKFEGAPKKDKDTRNATTQFTQTKNEATQYESKKNASTSTKREKTPTKPPTPQVQTQSSTANNNAQNIRRKANAIHNRLVAEREATQAQIQNTKRKAANIHNDINKYEGTPQAAQSPQASQASQAQIQNSKRKAANVHDRLVLQGYVQNANNKRKLEEAHRSAANIPLRNQAQIQNTKQKASAINQRLAEEAIMNQTSAKVMQDQAQTRAAALREQQVKPLVNTQNYSNSNPQGSNNAASKMVKQLSPRILDNLEDYKSGQEEVIKSALESILGNVNSQINTRAKKQEVAEEIIRNIKSRPLKNVAERDTVIKDILNDVIGETVTTRELSKTIIKGLAEKKKNEEEVLDDILSELVSNVQVNAAQKSQVRSVLMDIIDELESTEWDKKKDRQKLEAMLEQIIDTSTNADTQPIDTSKGTKKIAQTIMQKERVTAMKNVPVGMLSITPMGKNVQTTKSTANSQTLHNRIQGLLTSYGLQEHQVRGDGNCLFSSLSYLWYATEKNHAHIRKEIIDQVRRDQNDYLGLFQNNANAFETYLKDKSKAGTWGEQPELQSAANLYKRQILILTSYAENPVITITPKGGKPEFPPYILTYYTSIGAEHYNPALPNDEYVRIQNS